LSILPYCGTLVLKRVLKTAESRKPAQQEVNH
jgi:hypothetical protein